MQEVAAVLRNADLSAQKARLVVDQIRGLPIDRAINILKFSRKRAAGVVLKVLSSAVANAESNHSFDIDELYVSTVYVDQAASLKRIHQRAKGRADRITKPLCHITVKVALTDERS